MNMQNMQPSVTLHGIVSETGTLKMAYFLF